ncbi:hypothetical protein CBR_g2748 [Chara braunii]|uniref:Uncharacterized protein n=1 Tax=Chara braunii TaxID=69332 RepID=A0A388KDV7_CHABU|nr:hypothetical protein CBR_g2748 [Chara braunii]|eukprot:GBG68196.1 hypothetical protein CBR_g2748 [Chara braunii]
MGEPRDAKGEEEEEDRGRFREAAVAAAAAAAVSGDGPPAGLRSAGTSTTSAVSGPPLLSCLDEVLLALDDVCKKHPHFKGACDEMGSLISSLEPLVRVVDKHALRHWKMRSSSAAVGNSSSGMSTPVASSGGVGTGTGSSAQPRPFDHLPRVRQSRHNLPQADKQQAQGIDHGEDQQQRRERERESGEGGEEDQAAAAAADIDIVQVLIQLRGYVDDAREIAKTARRKCETYHGLFRQNCLSKRVRATKCLIDTFARDVLPLAELLLREVNIEDIKTFREELRKKLEACKARVYANERSYGATTASVCSGDLTALPDSVEMRDSARRIRQLMFTKATSSDMEAFFEIQEEAQKLLTTGEVDTDASILQRGGWTSQRVANEELYGLDEHVKKLKGVLTQSFRGAKVVGIVGVVKDSSQSGEGGSAEHVLKIGGVGKTTLARAVFNDVDVRRHFTGGLLWVDVHRINEVFAIQRKLWKKIAGAKTKLEGDISRILKRELAEKRILIVFDDVWGPETIEWVYGVMSANSKLLITTRDESIVNREGTTVYKLPTLNNDHSFRLLCQYAFGSVEPPPRFESLLEGVCKECAGLPIALKAVGSSLKGKGVEGWKYALRRLQGARTLGEQFSSEIISCVRFSFDGLAADDPRLQDLFLDFAAFMKNEKIHLEKLLLVWSTAKDIATEDEALALVAVLVGRALVEQGVDGDGKPFCRMHGVLQDMALQITRMAGKELKGKGHGMLSFKLAANAATKGESDDVAQRERIYLSGKAVNRWVEEVEAVGDPAESEGRPLPVFETRKVSLMRSNLSTFDIPVLMPRLEVLSLRKNSQLMEVSDQLMCSFEQLRVLDISNCPSIFYLPSSLTELMELRILDLAGCWRLRGLPESIGNLTHLRVLNLHKCKSLRSIPRSLGRLSNLRVLDMYGVEVARVLPFELGHLTALERLDISGLGLCEMPWDVGNLRNLRSLCMRNNHLEYLSEELNLLDKLISLDVSSNYLRALPFSLNEPLDNLTFLDVSCNRLKELPSTLGLCLTQLTILNISYNPLETLPSSIGMLDELRELHGWGTSLLKLPSSLSNLTNLKVLKLGAADNAGDDRGIFPGETSFTSISTALNRGNARHASNDNAASTEEEDGEPSVSFQSLQNLVDVGLEACSIPLPSLQSLTTVSSIKSLTFDCRNLKDARGIDLSPLQSLEYLRIGSTIPAAIWQSLAELKRLKELELFNLAGVVRFGRIDFSNLQQLEVLKLSGSNSIMFPGSVGKLTQLRELFIKGFGRLTHCDNVNFQNLACLEKATWWGCNSIERLPKTLGLAGKLVCIVVGHCPRLSLVPRAIGERSKKRQISFFTYNVCEPLKYF